MAKWLITIAFIAFALPASASAMNFTPSAADISLQAGERDSLEFQIENTSDITHTYGVSIYAVEFDETTGEPAFRAVEQQYQSWLLFDDYEFSLGSQASQMLTLTIAIPEFADADAVTFAPVVRESSDADTLFLSSGVSSLVFVTVGTPETSARVTAFAARPGIASQLPIELIAEIANDGERTVQPYGIVQVKNIFGSVVETIPFNSGFRRVPSGLSREFATTWGTDEGDRTILQEIWRELTAGFGLFTAELVAAPYPGAEATLQATTRLLVFPWRLALLVCALGVPVLYFVRNRRRA